MNHVFRTIWNEATGTFVAVAEIVKRRGKRSSGGRTGKVSADDVAGATSDAQRKLVTRRPSLMRLEPRLVFDGAAVDTAVEVVAENPVHDTAQPVDSHEAVAETAPPAVQTAQEADPVLNGGRKEVAFIDTAVADYQTLVDGIRDGVEVVLIDDSQDGLAQMAEWAETHSGYDAIHVLSHGSEGTLRLGVDTVTSASLADAKISAELAALGSALTAEGDLLVYGCSVASGEAGQAFVAALADATGADVAASDDATGAATRGGDWTLENSVGDVASGKIEVKSYNSTLSVTGTTVQMTPKDDPNTAWGSAAVGSGVEFDFGIASNAYDIDPVNNTFSITLDGGTSLETHFDLLFTGGNLDHFTSITKTSETGSHTGLVTATYSGKKISIDCGSDDGDSLNGWGYGGTIVFTFTSVDVGSSAPSLTSATYDASSNALTVTGTGMTAGDTIDETKLTITGQGGSTYTLVNQGAITAASETSISITLNATNEAGVEALLNKMGTASGDNTTYNIAADDDWDASVTAGDTSDLTGNAVTSAIHVTSTDTGGLATDGTFANSFTRTVAADVGNASFVFAAANQVGFQEANGLPLTGSYSGLFGYASDWGEEVNIYVDGYGYTFDLSGLTYAVASSATSDPSYDIRVAYAANPTSFTSVKTGTFSQGTGMNGQALSGITEVNDVVALKVYCASSADFYVLQNFLINDVRKIITGPTATNDTAAATEAGGVANGTASTNPTGNVVTNDTGASSVASFRTGNTEGQGTAGTLGQALAGTYGSLTLNSEGSYTYTVDNTDSDVAALAAGSTLHDYFNYTASDGSNTDDGVLDVTITGVNDAPVFTSASTASIAENGTGTVYTAASTDADTGATASYSIVAGGDGVKFNINSSTGALTFVSTPDYETATDANTDNDYVVTVRVSDGTTNTDQTVTVSVTNVNEAPVITSNAGGATAAINVAENVTAVTTVAATDVDAGATQTYSIIGGADQAKFSINSSTGVLTFASAPDYETATDNDANNTYVVQVQVSDGTNTDTQTITVTVTDSNDNSPVITSNSGGATASINVTENNTVVTTVTATDGDAGATQTYSLIGGADQAKFSINSSTGVLTFASAPDYETATDSDTNNTYVVQVQVSDGTNTDTQTITVTLTDTANENAPVISSNGGGTTASINVAEGVTAVTTVASTDADAGATATYSISGGADSAFFSIDASTGVLTFQAARDYETPADSGTNNTYVVQVQVSDGAFTDTQDITVTVTDTNDSAPAISSNAGGSTAAINVAENATAVTTVTATDADSTGTVTFSITGGADQALFSIDANTGVLTFTSVRDRESATDSDSNNTYVVIVQTSDGTQTDSQTITVTISDVNEATPSFTSATTANFTENGTGTIQTVAATDTDATASLSYSITGGADQAKFAIDAATGALTFVDAPDYETPTDAGGDNVYDVTVQVSDGTHTASQNIEVTVGDTANENAPEIGSNGGGATASINVAEGATAVTTVTSTDADAGATASYSISGGADSAFFSIDASTGVLTFAAVRDYENPADSGTNNTYVVQVQVSDGAFTDTQDITVTVTDTNDSAPAISSNAGGSTAAINVAENAAAVTTVTATDADSTGTVTFSITGGADQALFSIDANTGVLTFTSGRDRESATDADTNNTYVVIVQTSDGTQTDSQTITVTITDVNESTPAISSNDGGATASVSIAENTTAVTTVASSDADATASLTYSIVAGGDSNKFSINAATGTLAFTSAPDYETPTDGGTNNTYVVTVRASDGTNTDDQAISVTVTDVDEVAPNSPSFPSLHSSSDTDVIGDNKTSETTPLLTGTAEAGSTVKIYDGSTLIATTTADESGNWSANTTTLSLGNHSITVTATDADGNTSNASLALELEIVSLSPPPDYLPDLTPEPVSDTPAEPSQELTAQNTPETPPGDVEDHSSVTNIEPTYTNSDGFQVVVANTQGGGEGGDGTGGISGLSVYQGIRDQVINAGSEEITVVVPRDAFTHTEADAIISLTATMEDGTELPEWLTFDSKNGVFKGVPPAGYQGELNLKVIAKDNTGKVVETTFRIQVLEKQAQLPLSGKLGLTAQLRTHGAFAWKAERDRLIAHARDKGLRARDVNAGRVA